MRLGEFPLIKVYTLGSKVDFCGISEWGRKSGGGGPEGAGGATEDTDCRDASGKDIGDGGGGGAADDAAGEGGPLPKAFLAACIARLCERLSLLKEGAFGGGGGGVERAGGIVGAVNGGGGGLRADEGGGGGADGGVGAFVGGGGGGTAVEGFRDAIGGGGGGFDKLEGTGGARGGAISDED